MNVFELRGYASSDLEGPRQHLAMCETLRRSVLAGVRSAGDTSLLLSNELDRARLANALGEKAVLTDAIFDAASFAAAMTVRERVSGGLVELRNADEPLLQFPDGDTGGSPPSWLDGLACAVIANDRNACDCLASTIAFDAVINASAASGRPIGDEPFWPDYARALIALINGDPSAAAHAQRARQQMASGSVGVLVREALMATEAPVLQLIEIAAAGAKREWPGAVARAVERFHAYFSTPERAHSLPGYLPLPLLAVCKLALDRGFATPDPSAYLPAMAKSHDTLLAVRYPPQAILSAEEANWFLDLAGYPRAGRTHRLRDEHGTLVADYEASGAAGLPPASATFVYPSGHEDVGSPFALDAGQLLFLAQAFAEEASAVAASDSVRGPMLLKDAVACADAALARIPEGSDDVPRDSIHGVEGLAMLAAEPHRFRRSRLAAYRAGLAAQMPSLSSAPRPDAATPSAQDLRTDADAFADLIRAQAMPLLQEFARSSEDNIVATLRPRADDYAKVFVDEAVERARDVYDALWSTKLDMPRPSPAQSEIRCAVAPAGMFRWRNELSAQFPGGYQGIAPLLDPHRVWLAWQYVEPRKASGMAFDGLVWVDDHWAWFPRPYRYLADAGRR